MSDTFKNERLKKYHTLMQSEKYNTSAIITRKTEFNFNCIGAFLGIHPFVLSEPVRRDRSTLYLF